MRQEGKAQKLRRGAARGGGAAPLQKLKPEPSEELQRLRARQDTGPALEVVARPRPEALGPPRPCRGRPPIGWIGGARVMDEVERAPEGMAVRLALSAQGAYDRVRWGIYAAARLRRVRVSIARVEGFVHVWRLTARHLGA